MNAMMKLLLSTAVALMFTTPSFADAGDGGGAGMQKDQGYQGGGAGSVPSGSLTLVQQLNIQLADMKARYHSNGYNKRSYAYDRMRQIQQNLVAAVAAQNAGKPLPPIRNGAGGVWYPSPRQLAPFLATGGSIY